jgi:uncharacterized protein YggT (Ycf19 family)
MKDWLVLIANYSLSLFMWLILGRMALSLFTRNRNNFMLNFFIRFTEPVYKVVGIIFPFAKSPDNNEGTYWGTIGGLAAFFSILLIIIIRVIIIKLFGPIVTQ